MPANFEHIKRMYDFNFTTDATGKILCSGLTINGLKKIEKLLVSDEENGLNLARELLSSIATKVEVDSEDKEPASLTEDEVSQVTDAELEQFSEEYVKHNQWMLNAYKSEIKDEDTDDGKKRTVKKTPTALELPQMDGELASEYLKRFFKDYFDRMGKNLSKIFAPFSSAMSKSFFSTNATNALRENLGASQRLSESIKSLTRSSLPSNFLGSGIGSLHTEEPLLEAHRSPLLDLPENPTYETNRRLNRLIEHIEDLSPIIPQSAELLQTMNDAVLTMQVDLLANARKTARSTFIVIAIATVSLAITAFYSWWSYTDSKTDSVQQLKAQEALREAVVLAGQNNDQQIREILSNVSDKNSEHINALLKGLSDQNKELLNALKETSESEQESIKQTIQKVLEQQTAPQLKSVANTPDEGG